MKLRTRTLLGGAACAALVLGVAQPSTAAGPLDGVATDGLIAAYDFSETSGTVLTDAATANGAQNGTVTGGTAWDHGVMKFTGANYVKLPDNLLTGKTAASVAIEMKPTAATLSGNNFAWNIGGSGNAGTGQFFLHTPGHRASISKTNWTGEQTATTPSAFAAEKWQSVVVTIAPNAGASTSTIIVYVDGVEAARKSDSSSNVADLATQTNNLIGASAYTADPKFTGALSTYRLYDRALSGAEVATISEVDAVSVAQETVDAIALGDLTAVSQNLTLPTSGGVTWTTSDPAVVEANGAIHRAEGATPSATLTATATVRGKTATRTFSVTLAPLPGVNDRAQADLDAIALGGASGLGDVRDNLTIPAKGTTYASAITWTSEPQGIISTAAQDGRAPGLVTRPAYGQPDAQVQLTAKVAGTTATRTFAVTVRALPEPEDTSAYLFAHFTAGRSPAAINEQIYFAASENGQTWTDLNGEQPVLQSTVGETGARDPFLVRGPGGDKFYLIATDLSTAKYGWRYTPTNPGSRSLVVWESNDLVTWSAPRLVDVASKIPQAGNAWAPEATYDPATGQYLVYWASSTGAGASDPLGNTYGDYMNMYYATTRDFVTFSDPVKWIDRTSSIIDTTMIEVDGVFYRASGDGQITLERSTNPYATTVSDAALASNPGGWEKVSTLRDIFGTDNYSGARLEGPELFRFNDEDALTGPSGQKVPTWGLIADRYSAGTGYMAFRSTDLASTTPATAGGGWSVGSDITWDSVLKRHGTIVPVTQSEYDRLLQGFGDAAAKIASIAVTSAPTKTAYTVGEAFAAEGLKVTATTASGSTRVLDAREYTLSGFDSATPGTRTVRVTLDAAPQISTSFTVSVATAPVLAVNASVTARCVAGKVVQIVTVTNADGAPVTASVASPYGAKTLPVAAGKSASASFTTRLAAIDPGSVTIAASATVDGTQVSIEKTVPYPAADCG
ncbi:immunoglobulin-like domain-containing protein [Microbacterium sp. B2969]|uniref:Immunoglobulin-like domain-containing protein n=1 Tax=Microbacterium alkaliflavum TaxID=3248839 RepID=A0ABW7QCD6_9MICO